MFHFANAAILALVGQKLGVAHPGCASALVSACVVAAQLATSQTAILVGRRLETWGYRALLNPRPFFVVGTPTPVSAAHLVIRGSALTCSGVNDKTTLS